MSLELLNSKAQLDGLESPLLPPAELFGDPQQLAEAQARGVWLGFGDVVRIGFDTGWEDELTVVFNPDSNYHPQTASAGVLYPPGSPCLFQSTEWGVEMPNTTGATVVQVIGTLSLNMMQKLVRARWDDRVDVVRILCPNDTVRQPHWYTFAADLSLITDPRPYTFGPGGLQSAATPSILAVPMA